MGLIRAIEGDRGTKQHQINLPPLILPPDLQEASRADGLGRHGEAMLSETSGSVLPCSRNLLFNPKKSKLWELFVWTSAYEERSRNG